ncbi:DUF5368 family protein, partial [Acidimangrovimonas pyrenivorans]
RSRLDERPVAGQTHSHFSDIGGPVDVIALLGIAALGAVARQFWSMRPNPWRARRPRDPSPAPASWTEPHLPGRSSQHVATFRHENGDQWPAFGAKP